MKWKTQIYVMKMDKSSFVDNLLVHIQNVKCKYQANSSANVPFLRNSLSELVRHFPRDLRPWLLSVLPGGRSRNSVFML